MKYCVFGNVLKIIMAALRDDGRDNQVSVVMKVFHSFYESNYDFSIDPSLISRWVNGKKPVSPEIKQYYLNPEKSDKLTEDHRKAVLPDVLDLDILVRSLYELLMEDNFISERKKNELSSGYPYDCDDDKSAFVGRILLYTLERKEYSTDNAPVLAGNVHDRVIGAEVPPPCKTFCGRDKELEGLHKILTCGAKIFVTGIPGIGKSEFIKAYARNIVLNTAAYFTSVIPTI